MKPHDAMLNVYLNRFGEQIETVTTQTLPDSWPEDRGSMISPSYLLQILLPEETGSGQPNPADMFEGVLQELTDKFGGATSLRQYCCDPGHD